MDINNSSILNDVHMQTAEAMEETRAFENFREKNYSVFINQWFYYVIVKYYDMLFIISEVI